MSVLQEDFISPKYQVLVDHLRDQMESGTLSPGDRLPSFAEMRAQFGASPTTVGRVYALLENENLIVRERGRGIFVAKRERPSTRTIGLSGVSVAQYPHPYWAHVLHLLKEFASAAEYEILLLNETSTINWEKVDGVILYENNIEDSVSRMPVGMPIVALLFTSRKVPSVVADDYYGVYDLTQYLLSLGHRRIACLLDPLSPRREEGYRAAMRDAGIRVETDWIRHVHDEVFQHYIDTGRQCMEKWLKEDWEKLGCSAIVTQNDDTAIGVIEAMRNLGVRVPEDVSVTGFDGMENGRYFLPRITTVEVPIGDIVRVAFDLLIRQINGERVNTAITALPTRLLLRDSTAKMATQLRRSKDKLGSGS